MAKKKNKLSAGQAFAKLKSGNASFVKHQALDYPTSQQRKKFEKDQWPYAIILSCADSRVSPEIMFNASLNELFVVRVAGNIADTTSLASIEYAVANLNTNLIVVLGHSGCGAVSAAISNDTKAMDLGYNLNTLLGHITPAIVSVKKKRTYSRMSAGEKLKTTVIENAKLTSKELVTRSPTIAKERGVEIVPAYYDIVSGKVRFLRNLK